MIANPRSRAVSLRDLNDYLQSVDAWHAAACRRTEKLSAEINPTTNEPWEDEGDWGVDCNNLAEWCDRLGCVYDDIGFGGGNCTCT